MAGVRDPDRRTATTTRITPTAAKAAVFAGDRQGYQWWLEICRALDRRMASELAAGTGELG